MGWLRGSVVIGAEAGGDPVRPAKRPNMPDTTKPRLPPNQIITKKWPVLHYGMVPRVDLSTWRFKVRGAVERPLELGWEELNALPRREVACDIHCVTRWSRYDNLFGGVPVQELLGRAGVRPEGRFALVHDGEPLPPEHGGPVRLLVPHLYFWKSAKWVKGLEILEEDYPGFWEQNGYHMRGDPWAEERFGRPDPVRMRRGPR